MNIHRPCHTITTITTTITAIICTDRDGAIVDSYYVHRTIVTNTTSTTTATISTIIISATSTST